MKNLTTYTKILSGASLVAMMLCTAIPASAAENDEAQRAAVYWAQQDAEYGEGYEHEDHPIRRSDTYKKALGDALKQMAADKQAEALTRPAPQEHVRSWTQAEEAEDINNMADRLFDQAEREGPEGPTMRFMLDNAGSHSGLSITVLNRLETMEKAPDSEFAREVNAFRNKRQKEWDEKANDGEARLASVELGGGRLNDLLTQMQATDDAGRRAILEILVAEGNLEGAIALEGYYKNQ